MDYSTCRGPGNEPATGARGCTCRSSRPRIRRMRGRAASARIETATGPLTVTSVHVATGGDQDERLAALADALAERGKTERMIVGGDFNTARHFDEVYPGKSDYGAFFEKMRAVGFFECQLAAARPPGADLLAQGDGRALPGRPLLRERVARVEGSSVRGDREPAGRDAQAASRGRARVQRSRSGPASDGPVARRVLGGPP